MIKQLKAVAIAQKIKPMKNHEQFAEEFLNTATFDCEIMDFNNGRDDSNEHTLANIKVCVIIKLNSKVANLEYQTTNTQAYACKKPKLGLYDFENLKDLISHFKSECNENEVDEIATLLAGRIKGILKVQEFFDAYIEDTHLFRAMI